MTVRQLKNHNFGEDLLHHKKLEAAVLLRQQPFATSA